MKPTQQEIIELAREAGVDTYPEWLHGIPTVALERLVHLALERFGAGGGEPFAKVESALAYCTGFHARLIPGSRMPKVGTVLYTHPSPTDLRAEYLRGLEDAKKACESWANQHSSASGGCTHVDCDFMAAALDCAEAIEALKGNQ